MNPYLDNITVKSPGLLHFLYNAPDPDSQSC